MAKKQRKKSITQKFRFELHNKQLVKKERMRRKITPIMKKFSHITLYTHIKNIQKISQNVYEINMLVEVWKKLVHL